MEGPGSNPITYPQALPTSQNLPTSKNNVNHYGSGRKAEYNYILYVILINYTPGCHFSHFKFSTEDLNWSKKAATWTCLEYKDSPTPELAFIHIILVLLSSHISCKTCSDSLGRKQNYIVRCFIGGQINHI